MIHTLLSHQIKLKSDILPKLREELVFQNQFSNLALTMLGHIHERERGRELVFVGIHARRGDRIHVWKQRLVTRSLSLLFSNSQNQKPYCIFHPSDVQRFNCWTLRGKILQPCNGYFPKQNQQQQKKSDFPTDK